MEEFFGILILTVMIALYFAVQNNDTDKTGCIMSIASAVMLVGSIMGLVMIMHNLLAGIFFLIFLYGGFFLLVCRINNSKK